MPHSATSSNPLDTLTNTVWRELRFEYARRLENGRGVLGFSSTLACLLLTHAASTTSGWEGKSS